MKEGDELTEKARHLIALGRELERRGYPLSNGVGEDRKINTELVIELIEEKNRDPNEQQKSIFKDILKKLFGKKPLTDQQTQSGDGYGLGSTKNLEIQMNSAIANLRSDNTVDSDANDLRILQDMAKITALASTLPRGSKAVDVATHAMNYYSLTNKGNASLGTSLNSQTLEVNRKPLDVTLRYHLEKKTADPLDHRSLPITEEAKKAKERANQRFSSSVIDLRAKEGQ